METVDERLTVEEVAEIMDVNPQTVYRRVARGDIPGVHRVGKAITFIPAIFKRWWETSHVT